MIITIEGIDGSGKGTQAVLLEEAYRKLGVKVKMFSFPSYDKTFFGKEVGSYLRGEYGSIDQVHPKMASILYACDRFERTKEIDKLLAEGYVIICDRYTDSNIAHQVSKITDVKEQNEMIKWLDEMEFNVLGLNRPTVTLFLDVPHNITKELVLLKDERSYTSDDEDMHESNYDYLKNTSLLYNRLCEVRGWEKINCVHTNGDMMSVEEIHSKIMLKTTPLVSKYVEQLEKELV